MVLANCRKTWCFELCQALKAKEFCDVVCANLSRHVVAKTYIGERAKCQSRAKHARRRDKPIGARQGEPPKHQAKRYGKPKVVHTW